MAILKQMNSDGTTSTITNEFPIQIPVGSSSSFELITSKILEESSRDVELDISNVVFSDYLHVMFVPDIKIAGADSTNLYTRFNSISTNDYKRNGDTSLKGYITISPINQEGRYTGCNKILYFSPYEYDKKVTVWYINEESDSGHSEKIGLNVCTATTITYDELRTINLSTGSLNANMDVGSGLYLFGIRKP